MPFDSDGYPELAITPGQQHTFTYPHHQPATTLWYHDHALGITAQNVYAGLAGFYIVRDAAEQALPLPSGQYEVPLIVQDRTFNTDGSLQYPATWSPHVLGDTILVNGKVWPYLNVNQGKYRFRILNGSNARTFTFALSNGAPLIQIGSDQGLLSNPLTMTQLTLSPGERADCIIDFAPFAEGTEIILTNSRPRPIPRPAGRGRGPQRHEVRSHRHARLHRPGPLLTGPGHSNPRERSLGPPRLCHPPCRQRLHR